jgi:hypothetical protein
MNTQFKPNLTTYGYRRKYSVPLWTLIALICLITPFTNWLIPIAKSKVKGKLYYMVEK